ncbi:MAG: hypothetical protein GC206_13850 [Alphaproteobacteria bacterium]|nr:hypothetical protein [Alphaproteobacteria bacterium]
MRLLILAAFAAALAACASTPFYAPATGPGRPGYSDLQIERDRYRVTYRADGAADAQLIENYALLRAGQVTLSAGYDWFIVDRRTLDRGGSYSGPRASIGVGGGSFGGRGGVGLGVGLGFPLGGGGERALASTLDIRLGRGPKPAGPDAYDARQVVHALSAAARAP